MSDLSPLRRWLRAELQASFPTDGKYDSATRSWWDWLKVSHDEYAAIRKADPRHTSCVDFLTGVHRRICEQGYSGKGFGPFRLPGLRGYHGWNDVGDADPRDGDFFVNAGAYGPGSISHVGVLFEVWGGGGCTKIAGGGDKGLVGIITRDSLGFPDNMMGWLDIDEFYSDNPY